MDLTVYFPLLHLMNEPRLLVMGDGRCGMAGFAVAYSLQIVARAHAVQHTGDRDDIRYHFLEEIPSTPSVTVGNIDGEARSPVLNSMNWEYLSVPGSRYTSMRFDWRSTIHISGMP